MYKPGRQSAIVVATDAIITLYTLGANGFSPYDWGSYRHLILKQRLGCVLIVQSFWA
jgi:hypothetical protein